MTSECVQLDMLNIMGELRFTCSHGHNSNQEHLHQAACVGLPAHGPVAALAWLHAQHAHHMSASPLAFGIVHHLQAAVHTPLVTLILCSLSSCHVLLSISPLHAAGRCVGKACMNLSPTVTQQVTTTPSKGRHLRMIVRLI